MKSFYLIILSHLLTLDLTKGYISLIIYLYMYQFILLYKNKGDFIYVHSLNETSTNFRLNKFVKLTRVNEIDLKYGPKFLLGVSDLDYTRCISYCNANQECIYVLFRLKKCFICDINAIGYLSATRPGSKSVIYKKDLNDGF